MVLFVTFTSASALAQWQWTDSAGKRVFSDTPPPPNTPEQNILKRPGNERLNAPASIKAPVPAAAIVPTASQAKPGTDKELETRKKQAEQAQENQRKAELEKQATARAENCELARRAKVTLDSGVRLATTNAKGEREIMDDKARAAEAKRLDEIIRSDCTP